MKFRLMMDQKPYFEFGPGFDFDRAAESNPDPTPSISSVQDQSSVQDFSPADQSIADISFPAQCLDIKTSPSSTLKTEPINYSSENLLRTVFSRRKDSIFSQVKIPSFSKLIKLKVEASLPERQKFGLAPPVGVNKSEWFCAFGIPSGCQLFNRGCQSVDLGVIETLRAKCGNLISAEEAEADSQYKTFFHTNTHHLITSASSHALVAPSEHTVLVPIQEQRDILLIRSRFLQILNLFKSDQGAVPCELTDLLKNDDIRLFACPQHFFKKKSATSGAAADYPDLFPPNSSEPDLSRLGGLTAGVQLPRNKFSKAPGIYNFLLHLNRRWHLRFLKPTGEGPADVQLPIEEKMVGKYKAKKRSPPPRPENPAERRETRHRRTKTAEPTSPRTSRSGSSHSDGRSRSPQHSRGSNYHYPYHDDHYSRSPSSSRSTAASKKSYPDSKSYKSGSSQK